jgi:DNA-binding transcriptional LysR family regulator
LASGERSAETILWPAPAKLLPRYPDINVELTIDYGLTDIVAERHDAALGEQAARNMEGCSWRGFWPCSVFFAT